MASSIALTPTNRHSWLNGFGNMLSKENRQWWHTWMWAIQILIWLLIVNGMLAAAVLVTPQAQKMAQREEVSARLAAEGKETPAVPPVKQAALMVFYIFSAMAPAIGVVVIGQDAIIQERQTGTAAWVLSKPVSRSAFLLSKLTAHSLGILVTMVLVQGAVAAVIYRLAVGEMVYLPGFLGGLGLLFLVLFFYLALTFMLGSLFRTRGPVIGISIVVVFGSQLIGLAPWLGKIMPWNLLLDLPGAPSLAIAISSGLPLPTVTPIIGTVVMTILFILVALWRFNREEF